MNKLGYNIDEDRLKERLRDYTVSFEENNWTIFEKKLSTQKTQKPISLPAIDKKWLMASLLIILVIVGVFYFYMNPLHFNGNNKTQTEDGATPSAKIGSITNELGSDYSTKNSKKNSRPMIDSIIDAINKKNQINSNKATTVNSQPLPLVQKDTVPKPSPKHIQPESSIINEAKKEVHTEPEHKTKRKKKHKGVKDSIESIRSRSLEPNSSDDDIVVPTQE